VSAIAIVDHGAGNLISIAQALDTAGARVRIADEPRGLDGADALVLPGVGATGAAMARLRSAGFVDALRGWDGPLLGICVGLQLLFATSDEDGGSCLELIDGRVERLAAPRLPHIGWNELHDRHPAEPLFAGIATDATFYFVHSYAPAPDDPAVVIARATYEEPFVAAVRAGARVGVQFHPERSGRHGTRMISNFVHSVQLGEHAA